MIQYPAQTSFAMMPPQAPLLPMTEVPRLAGSNSLDNGEMNSILKATRGKRPFWESQQRLSL